MGFRLTDRIIDQVFDKSIISLDPENAPTYSGAKRCENLFPGRCNPSYKSPEIVVHFGNGMPEQATHISSSFDAALYGLRNDVLMMSSLTDRMFQTAFEALLTRNTELCDRVITEDDEIDVLEKQVDQDGVSLLIRFQPVASDMRQVISAMKVSTGLERVADLSVTIARRAKRLNSRPPVPEAALLEAAYQMAIAIFRDSMRTFAEGDDQLARMLKLRDKELDALTTDLGEKLVARATTDPEFVSSYVDLILVSRALERIADHATDIAEDAFWRDQAVDIRHTHRASESSSR
jgi:phosphate transport system protein